MHIYTHTHTYMNEFRFIHVERERGDEPLPPSVYSAGAQTTRGHR